MEAAQELIREQTRQIESRKTESALRNLRENLAPLVKAVNERSRSVYTYADKQIHEHPWGTAGTVFGLGLVVGALAVLAARHH